MPVRNGKFNPVLIKSALVPLIRELGLETDIHFDVINNNWENIVGKVNSMNTKPLSLKQGVLSISVSSPSICRPISLFRSLARSRTMRGKRSNRAAMGIIRVWRMPF